MIDTLSHVVSTRLFCLSKNKLVTRASKFQVFSLSDILYVGSIDMFLLKLTFAPIGKGDIRPILLRIIAIPSSRLLLLSLILISFRWSCVHVWLFFFADKITERSQSLLRSLQSNDLVRSVNLFMHIPLQSRTRRVFLKYFKTGSNDVWRAI